MRPFVTAAAAACMVLACSDGSGPGPSTPPPRTDAIGVWDATISGLPGSDAAGQPTTCTDTWIMTIEATDTGPEPFISTRIPVTAALRCGQGDPVFNGGIQLLRQFIVRQAGDTVAFLEPVTLDSFLVARLTDSLSLAGRLWDAAIPGVTFSAARRSDSADPNRAPYLPQIFPPWPAVEVGDTMTVPPLVYDAYLEQIADPPVAWSSSAPQFATIDEAGLIRGVAPGQATIGAAIDTFVTGFTIVVPPPPASVAIIAAPGVLALGDSAEVRGEARDGDGNVLPSRRFYWTSSNPGVATVSAHGEAAIIKSVAVGTTTVIARSTTVSASVSVEVQP